MGSIDPTYLNQIQDPLIFTMNTKFEVKVGKMEMTTRLGIHFGEICILVSAQ